MISLNILFALFVLTIVGCRGIPEEPEIAICTPILGYGEVPYVFCASDLNPDDPAKQYRVNLDEFLKGKPIMTPAQDYVKIIKWAEEVKNWGEKNCKQQIFDDSRIETMKKLLLLSPKEL